MERRRRDMNFLLDRIQEVPALIAERKDVAPASVNRNLPLCSDAELGTANALLRAFRELPRQLIGVDSADILPDYSSDQFSWRETIWAQVPACFDAVNVGLLMTRQAGDVPIVYALSFTNDGSDDDPYRQSRYCDIVATAAWAYLLETGDRQFMVDERSCVGLSEP